VESHGPNEAQVQSYSPMCPHGRAHWRNVANTIEPFGDAELSNYFDHLFVKKIHSVHVQSRSPYWVTFCCFLDVTTCRHFCVKASRGSSASEELLVGLVSCGRHLLCWLPVSFAAHSLSNRTVL